MRKLRRMNHMRKASCVGKMRRTLPTSNVGPARVESGAVSPSVVWVP
jgi:hypothetical protein